MVDVEYIVSYFPERNQVAYKNNRFNAAFIEIIEDVTGIRYLISHSNNLPILYEKEEIHFPNDS